MALHGTAALLGWFDYAPDGESELNEWLAREHMPERVAVPGFRRGRGFWSPEASPGHFIMYETTDLETFSSEPYLERLNNPTDWSRAIMPGFRVMKRIVCRVSGSAGASDGGVVATLEVEPAPRRGHDLRKYLTDTVIPELIRRPGVLAAHVLESDQETTATETVEKSLRLAEDEVAAWVVLVEGSSKDSIEKATGELLTADLVLGRGAIAVGRLNLYQLIYSVSGVPAP